MTLFDGAAGRTPTVWADPPTVHLAIVRPVYLGLILRGIKTAEARLMKTRRLPYTGLAAGDVIYFKASGGAVGARAVALRVHRFTLFAPGDAEAVRRRFERALGGAGEAYWRSKASARYAVIIELGGVEEVSRTPPWYQPAADRSAWRVCETRRAARRGACARRGRAGACSRLSSMRTVSDITLDPPAVIRKLPALLVNQIAAGEVIERPASVVKELVENAVDAGAGRIRVELEEGGIELVRVIDDGRGVGREQMRLALEPHATSKIAEPGDLDRIGTLGFRGEALASIASVARVTIRSRTPAEDSAWLIEGADGQIGDPRPAAGPSGTTIEARTLFYNTPARRKFLRTPQTEKTRCVDWIRDLALAHPAVAFEVVCDQKSVLDLPPRQSPRERIVAVLGREHEGQMLEVRVDEFDDSRGVMIWGLVGMPAIARPTPKAQHVFLNGRLIRDRTVQHALKESYRGLVEPGRHPTAVLIIEMSPGAVDVNVHPAKLEVRFRDQSMVHSAILRGVRDALRRADLTPAAPPNRIEFGPGNVGRSAETFAAEIKAMRAEAEARAAFPPVERVRQALAGTLPGEFPGESGPIADAVAGPRPPSADGGWSAPRPTGRVLQVHRSYLVTEDDRGIVIIDQHALHERVMFEKLLERLNRGGGRLESQGMLTPAVVDAAPAQVDRLDELTPLFERLGIEAAALGPRSVGVRAFPTLLLERGVDPGEFMADLLERHDREGFAPGDEAALHEVLDMMACKAAVKAGDRLTEGELEELMSLRERVERSASCPHGRPTTVRLSIEQLEKLFHRR